jgi:hypothetical protein
MGQPALAEPMALAQSTNWRHERSLTPSGNRMPATAETARDPIRASGPMVRTGKTEVPAFCDTPFGVRQCLRNAVSSVAAQGHLTGGRQLGQVVVAMKESRMIFGFCILAVLGGLSGVIAIGHVSQESSYGLDIALGALATLAGAFAQWAFGRHDQKPEDERKE